MTTATITSKGQVTIPAIIRSELHVGPGDRLEFVKVAEGRYEIIAAVHDITDLHGMVKTSGRSVSVQAMNAAIKNKARPL